MPTWVVTLDKDLLMLDTLRDILEGPDHPKLFQEPYDRCNPKFQAVESTDLGKMLVREGLPLKNLPSMRICGDMSYLLDTYAWVEYLPLGQMATTVISPDSIYRMGSAMKQTEEEDLVYKGPWVRSAQQRLFQTLENDYGFPKATCRSLVNLIWDFLHETYGEKLHEGQITFHAASASESPGKSVKELTTVPVHLTLHDRNDWLDATTVRSEMRKKAKDFGMMDALIVAQQRRLRCKVVSGDAHFVGVEGAVLL